MSFSVLNSMIFIYFHTYFIILIKLFGDGFSCDFNHFLPTPLILTISERVNHAPIFKTVLTNKTAVIGENITFEVEIHSDLHRSIEWIKGSCVLPDQEANCNRTKLYTKVMDETVIIM